MRYLPNSGQAIIDIRKIEDYCLSWTHPRGRHKARVFREALGIDRIDAPWLRHVLLEAAQHNEAFELATDALVPAGEWTCPLRDMARVLW
jgi:hypothetical protein